MFKLQVDDQNNLNVEEVKSWLLSTINHYWQKDIRDEVLSTWKWQKGTTVTYANVKKHVVSFVQCTYKFEKDNAVSLWDPQKLDLSSEQLIGTVSTEKD